MAGVLVEPVDLGRTGGAYTVSVSDRFTLVVAWALRDQRVDRVTVELRDDDTGRLSTLRTFRDDDARGRAQDYAYRLALALRRGG